MTACAAAHLWIKVGETLYRCPRCGACCKRWRGYPEAAAASEPDAEAHYRMLSAPARQVRMRRTPRRKG